MWFTSNSCPFWKVVLSMAICMQPMGQLLHAILRSSRLSAKYSPDMFSAFSKPDCLRLRVGSPFNWFRTLMLAAVPRSWYFSMTSVSTTASYSLLYILLYGAISGISTSSVPEITIAFRFLLPNTAPRPSLPKCRYVSTFTLAYRTMFTPASPIRIMLRLPLPGSTCLSILPMTSTEDTFQMLVASLSFTSSSWMDK